MKFIDSTADVAFLKGSSNLIFAKTAKKNEDALLCRTFYDEYANSIDGEAFRRAEIYPINNDPEDKMFGEEMKGEGILSPENLFDQFWPDYCLYAAKAIYISVTRQEIRDYNAQLCFDFDFLSIDPPCWLTEYAIWADSTAHRWKCDIFLALHWDKPRKLLPSLFLNTFDRIFERGRIAGEEVILQTRTAMKNKKKRKRAF